jgi:DNA repair protein RecN (Recombination protein N)
MLSELRIENFAIIDTLELTFEPGLITFTGETGAGKSIIIDAVDTVLGGRAEATMIRSGADRAIIEATFQLEPNRQPALQEILNREDLLESPDTLSLAREIRKNGRSIARVNGRSVSTSLLGELGEYLVDVHGQSEHLSLLRVREHVHLLDRFANLEPELAAYSETYRSIQAVRRELAELRQAESDAARRADLLTYQINEIDAAHLEAGEEDELRDERNRLANAEGLASITQEALQALDEGSPDTPSITDLMGQLVHALTSLVRLDPSQTALGEQSQGTLDTLSELSRSLHAYQDNIEFNPKRLDQVEERLSLIHNLKRKYGSDIAAVLAFADKARGQLDAITHAGERILELEAEETRLLEQLSVRGQEVSLKRKVAAEKLAKDIETELNDLNMSGARFEVEFDRQPDESGVLIQDGRRVAFHANGLEKVEFFVAPNPGEGLKPLVKIASGGETSRLMLALKNVLARADQIPTLIFDEIDQGIGGRVGAIVGRKLALLGKEHQVLCITHLPQLAAFGSQHFRVQKQVQGGRTHTLVDVVEGESRRHELAQMMGGVSDGTLRSAQELLQAASEKSDHTKKR